MRDKFLEHLVLILLSIALCAGGVYYWSYRVDRNRANAIQAFKECVTVHFLEPGHYLNPLLALLSQGIEVSKGQGCKVKLPDGLKREILSDPNFFTKSQLHGLRDKWKLPETPLAEPKSPAEWQQFFERLTITPSPSKQPGTVLFYDDMLSGKAFEPMIGPHCQASYDSEGYVVENIHERDPCELQLLPAGQFGEHVKVDMWVKLRSGENNRGYGILFAQQPADSERLFAYMVDTFGSYQLSQYTTSWHSLVPWKRDSNIRTGYNVWNRLTVEIRGQGVNLFANGQHVSSVAGFDVATGFVGCHLDAPGMVAVFRNITVSQL